MDFGKAATTEQAILEVRILIRKSLDRRRPVDLVFVDITKSFDSVPHEALFELIQQLGVLKNGVISKRELHEEPKRTTKIYNISSVNVEFAMV